MNKPAPNDPSARQEEIERLVRQLHETQDRLQALAGGGLDAVLAPDGHSFLLQAAQDRLRAQEQEQARLAKALTTETRRLQEAQRVASVGSWETDLETNEVDWSDETYRIFGLEDEVFEPTHERFLESVHEDDRDRVEDAFRFSIRTCQPSHIEHRIRLPDGSIRYVEERWQILEAHGKPVRALGTCQDISARKKAEHQRDRLFEASMDLLCVANLDGRLEQVNPAWTECLGWSRPELEGAHWLDLVHPEDHPKTRQVTQQLKEGQSLRDFENRYRTKHGSYKWLAWSCHPHIESNTVFAVARDITAERQVESHLRLLEASVSRLNDLVLITEASPITEPGPRILYVNEAFTRQTGYRRDEVLGKNPRFLQGKDTDPAALARIREALAAKRPIRETVINYSKSGKPYWMEIDISPVQDVTGEVRQFVSIQRDITARKKAEAALSQSEEQFRMLAEVVPQIIWVARPDGCTTYFNAHWTEYTGRTVEESLDDQWRESIHPQDQESATRAWEEAMHHGTLYSGEYRLRNRDGAYRWWLVRAEPLRDEKKEIQKWFGSCTDIHDLKEAEFQIARTNRALNMLSSCNEAVIRAESEDELLSTVCQIATGVGGYRTAWVGYVSQDHDKTVVPEAASGTSTDHLSEIQISWDESIPEGQGPGGKTLRSGHMVTVEDIEKDPSFSPWLESARTRGFRSLICLPLKDEQRVFGIFTLYLATPLQVREEELQLLEDLASDLAYGIISLRNRAQRQELHQAVLSIAQGVSASVGQQFFNELAMQLVTTLKARAGFISMLKLPDRNCAETLAYVVNGEVQKNFSYLVEATPCGQVIHETSLLVPQNIKQRFPHDGMLQTMGAEAYAGMALEDSQHRPIGLMAVFYQQPIDQPEFVHSALQIFAARASSELERQRADEQVREQAALLDEARDAIILRDMQNRITYWNKGAERLYGWTAQEAQGRSIEDLLHPSETTFAQAEETIRQTSEWAGELQEKSKSGEVLNLDARWTLITDEDGTPRSILSIDTDITGRKKLEQQFLRAQRMESIGTLAGGVAHDLNNCLGPIMMALDMLRMRFPDTESQEMLETITTSAERGASMVKQVLSFARGVEGDRVEVQIKHLVRDIEKITNETFLKNIEIHTDVPRDLLPVRGDPTQLHQVLLNLCVNARDAMPNGGTLTIRAYNQSIDATFAGLEDAVEPGDFVVIQVEDTGSGMPPEVIEKIFDPFFTTKEVGKGTGLGLSTSLGIVKSHHGFMQVYSEPGGGTNFKIYLPAKDHASVSNAESIAKTMPRGEGETVLVVDDESAVRQITKQTLETFGYRVILANDGAEAIAIYARKSSEIDVILTDMRMPVMDGPAAIQVLQRMNPEVPIIAASGLDTDGRTEQASDLGVRHFLPKPFTAEALLKLLQQVLKSRPSKTERSGG